MNTARLVELLAGSRKVDCGLGFVLFGGSRQFLGLRRFWSTWAGCTAYGSCLYLEVCGLGRRSNLNGCLESLF